MRRLLLCVLVFLPLCLLLQDRHYEVEGIDPAGPTGEPATTPITPVSGSESSSSLPGHVRQEFVGTIAVAPAAGGPSALPWAWLHQSGSQGLQYVLENHPLEFLQMALDRYDSEVEGYSCILRKRERVGGKLQPLERVECHFLEKPFSVSMKWLEGSRTCSASLWVEGKNEGLMWARGPGLLRFAVVQRPVNGPEAKATSRYTIDEFGIRWGTFRALNSLREARKTGLQARYLGEHDLPEVGGRRCYKFQFLYDPPDSEGLADLVLYFDVANWLQIGSILKDPDGGLLAEYFFRDVKLNPKFSPKQFEKDAI